jgi:hypothetical protein
MKRREALQTLAIGAAAMSAPRQLLAQIERRSAMYPMPGKYTDALRKKFNVVYRYLNAVDIGHGLLAEVLITNRGNEERAVNLLEDDGFQSVARMFVDPRKAPRLAVHEETVAPESVKVAPRLNRAFDWTHILHRQIHDVLATDFPIEQKKQWVLESYNWYCSERDDAFPGVLKTHDLMEHQWFSQYWRQKYPRFNAAIWAYHWYQLRLNEVMLDGDLKRRDAAVAETTAEFRSMFENPDLLPKHMPMAHTIAPTFLAEFPDIANSFDNLHSFHDIYNDILAHPKIADKKAEVYKQLGVFLDPQQAKETAPMQPLPATLTREDHRRLNQLEHLEHMAMMLITADEQIRFSRASREERAATVAKLRPEMAKHWANFVKKHAEMEHKHH